MSASEEQVRRAREIEQLYEAIDAHDAVCPCRHIPEYICRQREVLRKCMDSLMARPTTEGLDSQ